MDEEKDYAAKVFSLQRYLLQLTLHFSLDQQPAARLRVVYAQKRSHLSIPLGGISDIQ